jgi:hypothetical protein
MGFNSAFKGLIDNGGSSPKVSRSDCETEPEEIVELRLHSPRMPI